MSEFFTELNEQTEQFIAEQHMFFTASAAEETRINLSPKGMDTFQVLDRNTVAYLDVTGSGNETAAHIRQDGRLTIMFCGFTAKPNILRLYGRGQVIGQRDSAWKEYRSHFEAFAGERQIIVLNIESVQTSCGYAVPHYEYRGDRDTLSKWAERKGPEGIAAYSKERNAVSIDGLPTEFGEDA